MGNGTSLGRVRGHGSARHGAHHWIVQRVTAVGNLTLTIWLVVSLLLLHSYDYGTMTEWLASPLVALPMILMLVSIFWHLRLGLQVLIEDYVHDDGLKFGVLLLLSFFAFAFAATGIFAVAKIAFTAGVAG